MSKYQTIIIPAGMYMMDTGNQSTLNVTTLRSHMYTVQVLPDLCSLDGRRSMPRGS